MNLFHRSTKQETVGLHASAPQMVSSLQKLVSDDPKMLAALQNFLIVDPERQLPLLDNVETLLAKGNAARDQGFDQAARADYEIAAKIEIYKQNKESAASFLVLAEGVSEKLGAHFQYQETLLADMDKALRISLAYQALPLHTK